MANEIYNQLFVLSVDFCTVLHLYSLHLNQKKHRQQLFQLLPHIHVSLEPRHNIAENAAGSFADYLLLLHRKDSNWHEHHDKNLLCFDSDFKRLRVPCHDPVLEHKK